MTDSITQHIKNFIVRESHYGGKYNRRHYLPENLNIKKMYNLWKKIRKRTNLPFVVYETYRQVFQTKFNLGFGNSKKEVCSTCALSEKKLLAETDRFERKVLKVQKRLHQKRAEKFSQLMEKSRLTQGVLTVVFDLQHNPYQKQTSPKPTINAKSGLFIGYCYSFKKAAKK